MRGFVGDLGQPRTAWARHVPVLGALGCLAAFGLWQLTGRRDPEVATWVSDLGVLPVGVAATATCAWAAARANLPRLRGAWALVAVAFGCWLTGDVIWFVSDAILRQQPFPSAADVFYLAFYPALVAALLRFPAAPRSARQRAALGFDVATVFVAATMLVWYLVIGPIATSDHTPVIETVLSVAYPVGDLLVLFALLTALARGIAATPRRSIALLGVGILLALAADLAFSYLALHDDYVAGSWPDTLWLAALLLVVVAAWPEPVPETRARTVVEPSPRSR